MNLIAINELKSPKLLRKKLARDHELMLTSSGKPVAFLLEIQNPEDFDAELSALKEARCRIALSRLRESARESGADKMSHEDINEIIKKTRSDSK